MQSLLLCEFALHLLSIFEGVSLFEPLATVKHNPSAKLVCAQLLTLPAHLTTLHFAQSALRIQIRTTQPTHLLVSISVTFDEVFVCGG